MNKDKAARLERIRSKKQALADSMQELVSRKNLISRNHATPPADESPKLMLPFVVVHTNSRGSNTAPYVDCQLSEDRREVSFQFR